MSEILDPATGLIIPNVPEPGPGEPNWHPQEPGIPGAPAGPIDLSNATQLYE